MCNVRRYWRRFALALHHAFCQPLEPLRPRLALITLPKIGRVRQQFTPRNQDRAAEEIIDHVDTEFSVKKQDPNRLPCGSKMNEQMSICNVDRSPDREKGRHRSAHAEWHRRMGDRLSLRSAVAEATLVRFLPSSPRRLRPLLQFLFRPPR